MTARNRLRLAARIITFACLVHTAGFFVALPGHLDEASWSAHAQFHHVLGWIWLAGLNIAMIALAWGPLQRGERWTLPYLLLGFVFAQVAFFASMLLVPEGRPEETWFYGALGLLLIIYAVGLGLGWRTLAQPAAR